MSILELAFTHTLDKGIDFTLGIDFTFFYIHPLPVAPIIVYYFLCNINCVVLLCYFSGKTDAGTHRYSPMCECVCVLVLRMGPYPLKKTPANMCGILLKVRVVLFKNGWDKVDRFF